jgi:GntR family transcriptional regulator / MocR family aminotransferase
MDLGIFNGLQGSRITTESLCDLLIDSIENNRLQPGDKLPSSRDIATYLSISRTTVMKALDKLIARGFLMSSQGAGTWVANSSHSAKEQATETAASNTYPWQQRYSNLASTLSLQSSEPCGSDEFDEMNFGSSPVDLEPLTAWRKIVTRLSHNVDTIGFEPNRDVFGYRPLREAIAAFLRRSKGIICDPEQIVLASGVQSVVSPVFTLLVKPGDLAVCENPGFWGAREQFHGLGADVATIPVDEQGLLVDSLNELDRQPQWVYIASSCNEPTGVSLSESRRRALLNWCNQNNTAILEDDWDSDFHYSGEAPPSLFSLDTTGSVIYFYSFWRLLYPLVSVGFIVIPEKLIEVFHSYKNIWDRQFTMIEHYALTELLIEGHVESHIRSIWKVYRRKRQALIFALSKYLLPGITLLPSGAGMHVVVRFAETMPADFIQKCASESGLECSATTPYYTHAAPVNEFMLRFSHLPEDEILTRVEKFAEALNRQ